MASEDNGRMRSIPGRVDRRAIKTRLSMVRSTWRLQVQVERITEQTSEQKIVTKNEASCDVSNRSAQEKATREIRPVVDTESSIGTRDIKRRTLIGFFGLVRRPHQRLSRFHLQLFMLPLFCKCPQLSHSSYIGACCSCFFLNYTLQAMFVSSYF